MKRLALAALAGLTALAAPAPAEAGAGFTGHLESRYATRQTYQSFLNLPTMDYTKQGLVVQVPIFDLLEGLSTKRLDLGLSVYKTTTSGKITEEWKGVFQPGVSFEFSSGPGFAFDPLDVGLLAQGRMGIQKGADFGFGVYVVPGIGVGYVQDDLEMLVSGGLQVAAWKK